MHIVLRNRTRSEMFVERKDLESLWRRDDDPGDCAYPFKLGWGDHTFYYDLRSGRDKDFCKLLAVKEGGHMFQDFRTYLSQNKDTIFTVVLVAMIDQLLFEGAFREKLKTMIDEFLASKSKKTE